MSGRLDIVGLGPGAEALVTPEVTRALGEATHVLGYTPYVARVPPREGLMRTPSDNRVELERAEAGLALAEGGARAVLVSSGDPGVFAMASAVFEALEKRGGSACEVRVLPGVSAMLAAAARIGAPLGHDFCALNLSDNLKPWSTVERRLRLALEADFAIACYNPRSAARPDGFARALAVLRECCEPARPMVFARAVSTPEETLRTVSVAEAEPGFADMRTLVIVGSSTTRSVGRWLYTPRWAR